MNLLFLVDLGKLLRLQLLYSRSRERGETDISSFTGKSSTSASLIVGVSGINLVLAIVSMAFSMFAELLCTC